MIDEGRWKDVQYEAMNNWILIDLIERKECLESGDGLGGVMLSDEKQENDQKESFECK